MEPNSTHDRNFVGSLGRVSAKRIMKVHHFKWGEKWLLLGAVFLLTVTSVKGVAPYKLALDKAEAVTNQAFSQHTVLAIVLPQGEAVFAVSTHKDEAVAKAVSLAETAAKQANKAEVVLPEAITFKTSEQLFATVSPETRNMPGVHVLVADKACGQKVTRTQFPCNQVGTNFAKAVYFEHYICESGTNGCWMVKAVPLHGNH